MEDRKKAHIDLVFQSQTLQQTAPLWVSSMTGGTELAKTINSNLARVCKEFGIGMGMGSCRALLDDDSCIGDFDMRHLVGDELPFYANLGIAQVENMIEEREIDKISTMLDKLRADGLIVHVNPLQEWIQPEGDRLKKPPIDTIKSLLDKVKYPVVVKEVGQGMGPASLRELLKLPLQAIEFGAYGGTNFTKLELLRSDDRNQHFFEPMARVGHDTEEMTEMVNQIVRDEESIACKEIIISGGITSFLQGYYLIQKCVLPAVYGQASSFLKYAKESYEDLYEYVDHQVRGIKMASTYLSVKDNP